MIGDLDLGAFGVGVAAGCVALLVSAIVALATRRGRRPGVLGVPFALAALVAVRGEGHRLDVVPAAVFIGVLVLAAGGQIADRVKPPWLRPAVFVPGAALIAGAPLDGLTVAARVALALATVVAALAFSDFEGAHTRDGFALLLLPIAAFTPALLIAGGTDVGAAFAGALLPLVVVALPLPLASLGTAGCAALAGAYMWVGGLVSANRFGRLAAIVAGLGLLLYEPAHRFIIRRPVPSRRRRRAKQLDESRSVILLTGCIGQIAIVGYVALLSARRSSDIAVLTLLPVVVVGTLLGRAFVPSPRRFGARSRHVETMR